MTAPPVRTPRNRGRANRGSRRAGARDPLTSEIFDRLGSRNECLHNADPLQKPCSAPFTFDFLNPEARLLLTRFPRFAQAPEFGESSHLRLTPLRILTNWGLTNGINGVMIDCMHGVNHFLAGLSADSERSGSRIGDSARDGRAGNCGPCGSWTSHCEHPALRFGLTSRGT
jgi:hypothetical protein